MLTQEEIKLIREIRIHKILGVGDNGRRVALRCPFPGHPGDNTPSFTLYPDNSYHCYGCKENGNGALDFCIAMGYSFKEACEELINYL